MLEIHGIKKKYYAIEVAMYQDGWTKCIECYRASYEHKNFLQDIIEAIFLLIGGLV